MSRHVVEWTPGEEQLVHEWEILVREAGTDGQWTTWHSTRATRCELTLPDYGLYEVAICPIVNGVPTPPGDAQVLTIDAGSTADLLLPTAPATLCLGQIGDAVRATWTPTTEPHVTEFELRWGASWEAGLLIARVPAVQSALVFWPWGSGSLTVWVAARTRLGVTSGPATATITVLSSGTTAATYDEAAGGFTGTKTGLEVSGGNLRPTVRGPTVADLSGACADYASWFGTTDSGGTYVTAWKDVGSVGDQRVEVAPGFSLTKPGSPTAAEWDAPMRPEFSADGTTANSPGTLSPYDYVRADGTLISGLGLGVEIDTAQDGVPTSDGWRCWTPGAVYRFRQVRLRFTFVCPWPWFHMTMSALTWKRQVAVSASGAPTDAEYIVAATHVDLSAERVVTNTATVTWDNTVAGQSKANVPDGGISYAKIQNVNDARLLGRSSGSAGPPIEITVGAGLSLSAGSLTATAGSHAVLDGSVHSDSVAQSPAEGAMIVGNATPKWSRLDPGLEAQVLRLNATPAPEWAYLTGAAFGSIADANRVFATVAAPGSAAPSFRALVSADLPAHASLHKHGGADEVATATAAANAIPKAGAGGTLAIGWIPTGTSSTTVCIGDDARLSDSRTPTSHHASHESGGGDAIKLDDLAAPDDNTDLNVSTTKHGLAPKAPNDTDKFLRGDASWAAAFPTGGVIDWPTTSAPTGWLLCDGAAVSRTTYAALFAVIGTTFGVGDGSTTFNVPNAKGRTCVAYDSTQTEFDALGETGGAKTHTLTSAEMPSHTHTQDAHTHTQNSHNHTQDSHNHTQNSHNHTQDSHKHLERGTSSATGNFTGLVVDTSSGGNGASPGSMTDCSVGFETAVTTATNQAATATNIAATATNQAATATNQNATATNQNTGGGGAHNNLQPYLVIGPKIIKT